MAEAVIATRKMVVTTGCQPRGTNRAAAAFAVTIARIGSIARSFRPASARLDGRPHQSTCSAGRSRYSSSGGVTVSALQRRHQPFVLLHDDVPAVVGLHVLPAVTAHLRPQPIV